MRKDFGVLYCCDNNPAYRRMLSISVESLYKHHPDWPIHVFNLPTRRESFFKKLYKIVSFWKNQKRYDRGNQNFKLISLKAHAWQQTPFNYTLFMDVDTVVNYSLSSAKERAMKVDVMLTPIDWKIYHGCADWMPEAFPYMMSGVVFCNQIFIESYKKYLQRLSNILYKMPTGDQYVFSLTCFKEKENLKVMYDRKLQLDVLNVDQHLGTYQYKRVNKMLSLSEPGLEKFNVFHYNHYKPQYMEQIKMKWGYPSNDFSLEKLITEKELQLYD